MTSSSETYRRICAWENLLQAHRKAARGKRTHHAPAAAFEHRLADRLLALNNELERGSYRPGPYVHFLSIDHEILRHALARVVPEEDVMGLVDLFVAYNNISSRISKIRPPRHRLSIPCYDPKRICRLPSGGIQEYLVANQTRLIE